MNLRAVLENVSLADVANEQLPGFLTTLTSDPGAWERRTRPATTADEGAARG